jgi:K+-sensing histidine kinase KdpD
MSSYPPPGPGFGGVGQRIEEAIELIEMELRHAAAYVNQAVIPQVRKESIFALRNVANSLRTFADRLDAQQQAQQQHAQQQAPPPAPRDPRA